MRAAATVPGYRVGPATPGDLDAIVELFDAYDVWNFGQPDTVREHLEADFDLPGFDPALDSWLVTDSVRAVVGFAYVLGGHGGDSHDAFARVHPSHHGRGIGAFLVDAAEGRARQRVGGAPEARLWNSISATDLQAADLLCGRGFLPVRHCWHMERSLSEGLPIPEPPAGIEVRALQAGEELQVHAAMEESFAEHWGTGAPPFEQWRAFMDAPGFDLGLVLVAVDGDEIVGEVDSMGTPDAAWVNVLGVRPAWRGRGIGTLLLLRAFADLAGRGHRGVRLNVDAGNETGATRLYERVGMTVRREWLVYEKLLAG